MADVSRPPPRRGTAASSGASGDDRGQLFLIGALSIAVLFVGFALLLNTAIFTENLATRNTDPGTDPSIGYRTAATDAASGIMVRENLNNTDEDAPYSTIENRYIDGVDAWSDGAGIHSARRARIVDVRVDSAVHGTRFEQTNVSREFTNASGIRSDWDVEDDVKVRDVQFTVERSELESSNLGGLLSDDPFRMYLESSSDPTKNWSVFVYKEGSNDVSVTVMNATDSVECSASVGSHAVVDISGGHINDTACPAFQNTLDLDGQEVDVSFENGDEAVGRYHLVVDSGVSLGSDENHVDNAEDGSPFVTAVVYEADVVITYESTDVYYETTIRVAPGEL